MDRRSRFAWLLSAPIVAAACGDADPVPSRSGGGPDAGSSGSAGGSRGGAAAGGRGGGGGGPSGAGGVVIPPVVCGGDTCKDPDPASGLQGYACCTTSDACGVRVPISPKCLPFGQPGHINPVCLPLDLPTDVTLPGCCSPVGCGALATFDDVGCIPNQDIGRPAVDCVFDQTGSGDASAP